MLTWTAPDGSQGLGNALEYEVAYKRDWESWEVRAGRAELTWPGLQQPFAWLRAYGKCHPNGQPFGSQAL